VPRYIARKVVSWFLMIVVATKVDATTDRTKLEELQKFCAKRSLEFHAISAATGEGVRELVREIADALDKIPKPEPEVEVEQAHIDPAQDDFQTPA